MLATVELVDGMMLTEELPVTPDLNVGKVVEICTHFLELADARADTMGASSFACVCFVCLGAVEACTVPTDSLVLVFLSVAARRVGAGIFVYDIPPDGERAADPDASKPYHDLVRSPRPLRNEDYMGDVIVQKARQKREFKFVYKRKVCGGVLPCHVVCVQKSCDALGALDFVRGLRWFVQIFLPSQNTPSDDKMFTRLVYLQAEDEVITQGNLPIKAEDLALRLTSIRCVRERVTSLTQHRTMYTPSLVLLFCDHARRFPSYRVALDEDFPFDADAMLNNEECPLMDFVVPEWRDRKSPEDWANLVLANRGALLQQDPEELQEVRCGGERAWVLWLVRRVVLVTVPVPFVAGFLRLLGFGDTCRNSFATCARTTSTGRTSSTCTSSTTTLRSYVTCACPTSAGYACTPFGHKR